MCFSIVLVIFFVYKPNYQLEKQDCYSFITPDIVYILDYVCVYVLLVNELEVEGESKCLCNSCSGEYVLVSFVYEMSWEENFEFS